MYQDNINFREMIKGLSYDYTYEEGPGDHDWAYWDMMVQKVLVWLDLPPAAVAA